MTDTLESTVDAAVKALQSEDAMAIDVAFQGLAGLNPKELLAELFLQVGEAADAGDLDELLELVRLALPPQPRTIVQSVRNRDVEGIVAVVGTDFGEIIASLLVITAALDEASTRL